MTKIKIALIQMKMSSDTQKNMSVAIKKIKEASKKKAKVICLPELFLSNYFCQEEKHSNFNLAEKIPGRTTDILSSLAKDLKIISDGDNELDIIDNNEKRKDINLQ